MGHCPTHLQLSNDQNQTSLKVCQLQKCRHPWFVSFPPSPGKSGVTLLERSVTHPQGWLHHHCFTRDDLPVSPQDDLVLQRNSTSQRTHNGLTTDSQRTRGLLGVTVKKEPATDWYPALTWPWLKNPFSLRRSSMIQQGI